MRVRARQAPGERRQTMTTNAIKALVQVIYEERRDRRVNPEGTFDNAGRWYPSEAEDAGVSRTLRSPSRARPYTYMAGCRTRKHVSVLVERVLAGLGAPADVACVVKIAQSPAVGNLSELAPDHVVQEVA